MSFTNRQLDEILENLEDLAVDFKSIGRTGTWRVLVDAARVVKLHQYNRRVPWIESNKRRVINARKTRSDDGIVVLSGPKFAIIEASNESGRRAMSSSNASPDQFQPQEGRNG